MKISAIGKNEILSKKEIKYLVRHCLSQLLHTKSLKYVDLKVYSKVFPYGQRTSDFGNCTYIGKSEITGKKHFEILLNISCNRKTQRIILCHECVHITQFYTGQLRLDGTGQYFMWGKTMVDDDKCNYYKLPWEKEAWKLQEKLYVNYIEHIKENNLRF